MNAPRRMPTNEAEIQRMRADQALRILETLNAASTSFEVRRYANEWTVSGARIRCAGVDLTDALAQFATAVSL